MRFSVLPAAEVRRLSRSTLSPIDFVSTASSTTCHIILGAKAKQMLSVKQLAAIESPWTTMPPVRLGKVPAGLGTADLFVTISDDDRPLVRVDIYGDFSSETFTFQDALVWCERVFVGFGHRVFVIDPKTRLASEIFLDEVGEGFGYFGDFYAGKDYLLVASGDSLLRLSSDGKVLWSAPNLGLDGVVVTSVQNGTIQGDGEWDPPGGWKPFALRLDSGELLAG
jgi:hypothetical protein